MRESPTTVVFGGDGRTLFITAPSSLYSVELNTVPEPLLGDVNRDGQVNGLDADPFVNVLLSGPYQPAADMNDDQVVNGLDVAPFVAAVVGGTQQVPEPSTLFLAPPRSGSPLRFSASSVPLR